MLSSGDLPRPRQQHRALGVCEATGGREPALPEGTGERKAQVTSSQPVRP